MNQTVLDASVFVAAISPAEVHHAAARDLFDAHPATRPFLVPSLFRVEVLAALARRGEPDELLDAVAALVSSQRFHSIEVDSALIDHALQVARTARLRAYDSIYVALAMDRGATLLTLDAELRTKAALAFPELQTS